MTVLCTTAVGMSLAGTGRAPSQNDDHGLVAAGGSPSWISVVEKQIADSEYEITWQPRPALAGIDAAWQAPNRSHGFRTYFTIAGIRVVPRGGGGGELPAPAWEWALRLHGFGRPGEVIQGAAVSAAGRVEKNRIEYDRGSIVEWYVNDRRGLEQGFTLVDPPTGAPVGVPTDAPSPSLVAIELALSGTLAPVISEDGQAIDFETPQGVRVVHYGSLAVRDARGRELHAWMDGFARSGSRGIRILFDDRDASYPVTVDPLAVSAAWTADGDQASGVFGYSVATAGDVNGDGYSDVIVAAYQYDNGQSDEGRAYVYHGSASGLAASAAWTAEPNIGGAAFGYSAAPAGDVNGDGYSDVIIGAQNLTNGQTQEGRAYVYHGSAAGLQASPAWTAESDQPSARFSNSVASAGDVNGDGYSDVIVGDYHFDNNEADEGRAFVYHGSASGLQATPAWLLSAVQAGVA